MSRIRLVWLLGLTLAVSGMSLAKDHRDKDRDHDRDDDRRVLNHHRDHDRDRDDDRRVLRGRRHGDHDRDDRRHDIVIGRRDSRPPGWSHGKKTGWGDCDVPPGQAKKVGCHPNRRIVIRRRDRDHDHDRDRHRRPVTMPVRTSPSASGTPSNVPVRTTQRPVRRGGNVADTDRPVRVRDVQQ
jgi:hypothetical protein